MIRDINTASNLLLFFLLTILNIILFLMFKILSVQYTKSFNYPVQLPNYQSFPKLISSADSWLHLQQPGAHEELQKVHLC